MATPTFVGAGAVVANATALSPALPAGWMENDILVIVFLCSSSDTPVTPSGWTEMGVTTNSNLKLVLYWRRATASETDPVPLADVGTTMAAVCFAVRGCKTSGDPFNATATDFEPNNDTSVSIAGLTTTVDDCLIVDVLAARPGALRSLSGWTNASLTSITEGWDGGASIAGMVAGAYGEKAVAGVVDATTATLSGTVSSAGKLLRKLAFEPSIADQTDSSKFLFLF